MSDVGLHVVGQKLCLSVNDIDMWNVRQPPFIHPSHNVIQWLVEVIAIFLFKSRCRDVPSQDHALACCPLNVMFVFQEANLEILTRKLFAAVAAATIEEEEQKASSISTVSAA